MNNFKFNSSSNLSQLTHLDIGISTKKSINGLLILILFFFGCSSENEKIGVQKVSDFYGCQVSTSIGTAASTGEGYKKYFELKLSGIEYFEGFDATKIAKNSARIFYAELLPEERENYTHIIVEVEENKEGQTNSTKVETQTKILELVLKKENLYYKSSAFIRDHNYNEFYSNCAPLILPTIDSVKMNAIFRSFDTKFGSYKGEYIKGYDLHETEFEGVKLKLIQFYGVQERDSANLRFNINVSQDTTDNAFYGFDF